MRHLFAVLLVTSAFSQTPPPNALRDLLLQAREHSQEHIETRGATPAFTTIKHTLRDWIESRLTSLDRKDQDTVLAFQLNFELRAAGLSCEYGHDTDASQCPEENATGFLDDISIRRSGEFLIIQTAVRIQCGRDESAYLYDWNGNRWRRVWETEQNEYTKEKYLPQNLRTVVISPSNSLPRAAATGNLIVTLGTNPWCSSNWQPVYYRVWQLLPGRANSKLLLDEMEIGFIAEPLQAAAWPDDVLIEYAVGSSDTGVHNRRQIRHYILKKGALERVDPVVLSPRDFVDFWRSDHGADAQRRTSANLQPGLATWRGKLKSYYEYIYPTRHCAQQRDLWQVGIEDPKSKVPPIYFLVQWRPPYHFSMRGVSGRPWPNCTEEDPAADEFRTLFPDQDWHP